MSTPARTRAGFAPEMQRKQFVAKVRANTGFEFNVYTTGSDRHYLFCPVDRNGCEGTLAWPVLRADIRPDIRHGLAHGVGYQAAAPVVSTTPDTTT